jgi:hypothetical protein
MLGPAMKPTPVQLRRWRSSVSESGRLALALAVSTGLAVVVVLLLLRDGGFPTPTNAESPQPIPGPTARASLPRVDPYRRDGAGQACEVLVQNGEGAPVLGCVVLVWRRNHAGLAQATTDAAGRATFETQGGAGGFWLPAWEMAPVFVSVPELSGGHTLVVGPGESVSGAVLVDGAPGPEGMQLSLLSELTPLDGAPVEVQAALAAARVRTATTGLGGTFSFVDLVHGWRGQLSLPATHWLLPPEGERESSPRLLSLDSARHNLVVHTVSLPIVHGSVVWEDNGQPVDGLEIGANARMDEGLRASGITATENGGKFRFGLEVGREHYSRWVDCKRRPAVEHLLLAAGRGAPIEPFAQEIANPDLSAPISVRLKRLAVTHFVALDVRSQPIAGAIVGDPPSEPTDEQGRGWFSGRPRFVGAPLHAVVPAISRSGIGTIVDPLRFELPARNTVTVVLTSPTAALFRGLSVMLESESPLSAGASERHPFHDKFGGREVERGQRRTHLGRDAGTLHTLTCAADSSGRTVFHSLEPGAAAEAVVVDSMGNRLAQATVLMPGYGSGSEVVLHMTSTARNISGQVTDAADRPVPKATARLSYAQAGLERSVRVVTDDRGEFAFSGIHSDAAVDLLILAQGFVPLLQRGLTRTSNEQALRLQLHAGNAKTVRVLDPVGRAVDLFAKPDGYEFQFIECERLGPGAFRWRDLPLDVTFVVDVGGERFTQFAGPGAHDVLLSVPGLAAVAAPLRMFPSVSAHKAVECCLELSRLDGRGKPVRVRYENEPGSTLLLPGSYSVMLVRAEVQPDGTTRFLPLGINKVVDLVANQTLLLQLP